MNPIQFTGFTLPAVLLWAMVIGIFIIKAMWISREVTSYKQRLNWSLIKTNAVEALILFLQVLVIFVWPLPATPFDGLILWIGVAMYVAGVILVFWARHTMRQSWGIPGEHHVKQQDQLVTSGPFSFSRNPIYLGFILIYFGFCIAIKSWLIVLRFPLAWYFYKSAKSEEKLLEKHFGEKYVAYKKRVPLFLFI